jgi:TnpA family transposase
MGLTAMSEASSISYDVLAWTAEWCLRQQILREANAAIVDYHHRLPMSRMSDPAHCPRRTVSGSKCAVSR